MSPIRVDHCEPERVANLLRGVGVEVYRPMSPSVARWWARWHTDCRRNFWLMMRWCYYEDARKYNGAILELNRLREEATR